MRYLALSAFLLLTSCDNSPPSPQDNQVQQQSQPQESRGGLGEQMATAAVGGFAAGAGAAVGHHAATAAIDKFKTRRRAARIQSFRARRR